MLAPRPTKLRSQRDINLWRIPLNLSLAAVALFAITLIPDILDKCEIIHIPSWLTMGSIDDARAILAAMMGAVATVLALIFSVALLVLSMVSTLFGPRLLYRFLQDWVTQVTIGLFMGTFVYICLVFLVTHQDPQSTFIPQVSLIMSWVLVVVSFGFLVYYSHRVAKSIQNPDMIGAIVDDLYVAAGRAHVSGPGEGTGPLPDDDAILRQAETGATVLSQKSGYLQHVDHGELVAAARAADALIVLKFRPGQFVFHGEPLASIVPANKVDGMAMAVDRGIYIGRHRTLTQDSEFGIAQVVEIAIRALSPARSTILLQALRPSTGSQKRYLLSLNTRLLKEIGTTLVDGCEYGCHPCGSNVSPNSPSIRFAGVRNDASCAYSAARRHQSACAATSERLPSNTIRGSRCDSRNRECASNSRSPRPGSRPPPNPGHSMSCRSPRGFELFRRHYAVRLSTSRPYTFCWHTKLQWLR